MATLANTGYTNASGAVSTTALALTAAPFSVSAANMALADSCRITCDTQPVRYTYDGTTPTSAVGHILAINTTITVVGNANINALQFIRQGGSDGNISVTLEK